MNYKVIFSLIFMFHGHSFADSGCKTWLSFLKSDPELNDEHTQAVRQGDLESVDYFIDLDPNVVCARNEFGSTLLHQATSLGHYEIAELLITKGANINAMNTFRNTPLHNAVISGYYEVAELLIAKGVNIHLRDMYGETPLHSATILGHYELSELLIAKRADVNAINKFNETPLHNAALGGSYEVAELLITNGANVENINLEEIRREIPTYRFLLPQLRYNKIFELLRTLQK